MQASARLGQKYVTANGKPIENLGSRVPHFSFADGSFGALNFEVCKVHKPLVSAVKIVEAQHRITMQPEDWGPSTIENLNTGSVKRIFARNGVFVLPAWIQKPAAKQQLEPPLLAPLEAGGSSSSAGQRAAAPAHPLAWQGR